MGRSSHSSSGRRSASAFTLVELLVVIGIIVLLVGILIPMANRVRVAAQRTVTLNTLNRISQACEAYFTDFGSYPGLFDDATQVLPFGTTGVAATYDNYPTSLDANGFVAPTGGTLAVTSTENLYLSLLGGLRTVTTGAAVSFDFDLKTVGNGAANMNPLKPVKSQAYLQVSPRELTTGVINRAGSYAPGLWGHQTRGANVNGTIGSYTTDTLLPEVLDGFSSPQPILYMRANRGSNGYIDTAATYDPNVQYNVAQIGLYDFPLLATLNTDVKHQDRTFGYYYPAVTIGANTFAAGPYTYLLNDQASATTGVVLQKDKYLLISAGEDGFYGTADDIHN